jgi:hypothetical protein
MSLSVEDFVRDLAAGEPHGVLNPRVLFRATLPVEVAAESDGGATPVVFFPDIHILSKGRAKGYGDFFNLSASNEGLLKGTLQRLLELRETVSEYSGLLVYQLGDFHDLWREAEHWWWHEDLGSMIQRQVEDHPDIFDLLGRLETHRVVGNHDDRLRVAGELEKLEGDPISRYFPLGRIHPAWTWFRWGFFGRIGVLHADAFDKVETGFFSFLNPVGARLAQHSGGINIGEVDEWQHEVLPPGTPDAPADPELLQRNVDYSDAAAPKDRKKYFTQTREFFDKPDVAQAGGGYVSIAAVIGHTHAPRIVADSRDTGFTLVDCGSWVNVSRPAGPVGREFMNSQIGVLASNEIAVLQVGPT